MRSNFDSEGQRIVLKEDFGEPDIVVDDVTTMKWPNKLDLTIEEKVIGGSNTVVFMLRPSL